MNENVELKRRKVAARIANGNMSATTMYSKAKRGWREGGGWRVFFRSRMEANYARYLDFLGVAWQYEPRTFWFEGIKRGVVSYTPDFYLPAEDKYVELKGWMDARSATKIRRMGKYHPEVVLEVIEWPQYQQIARQAKLIPGWEFD